MKNIALAFLLLSPTIVHARPQPSKAYLTCPSQYADCTYRCPTKYSLFEHGCTPVKGTECRRTGNIIYMIPSGDPNGWIVAFHINNQFPDLICR